eukprot:TRINITY_DN2999_c0_g3_i1.p1 TRINITY_DN2999_c0_g3~~TRINITY_DN2999_c0_g3_i1.p1  ORF type:complete len:426 (-),score=65.47 TRINITY_DN2999_c0_g3_i1:850-2127(-)
MALRLTLNRPSCRTWGRVRQPRLVPCAMRMPFRPGSFEAKSFVGPAHDRDNGLSSGASVEHTVPDMTKTTDTGSQGGVGKSSTLSSGVSSRHPLHNAAASIRSAPSAADLLALGKHRLSAMVAFSGAAGFVLAAGLPAAVTLPSAAVALGVTLQSMSANGANQLIECRYDAVMKRTRQRPLPSGRVPMRSAAVFCAASGLMGTAMLAAVSPTAAAIGVATWGLYVLAYTPLKRHHWSNTWVGAVVGALPPLIGAAAAIQGGALVGPTAVAAAGCAVVLFSWQLPHFLALAVMHRGDYASAGYKMMPSYPNGLRRSGFAALRHAVIAAVAGTVVLGSLCSVAYLCEAFALSAVFVAAAGAFARAPGAASARRMFFLSLLYLPGVLLLAILHRLDIEGGKPRDIFGCPGVPFLSQIWTQSSCPVSPA